jgi:predicted Zn-dependent protease
MPRWLAYGLLVLAAGCGGSSFNPATQRQEYSLVSDQKEAEVGRKAARRVERQLTLVVDVAMQQRVRAIGDRLTAVAERKDLVYSFEVIDEPSINAFSLPGGYVFVHRGLVELAGSDDELAAVIGHEIAHITARHAVKRYQSSLGLTAARLAALIARQPGAASGVGLAGLTTQLAYARQEELEADRLGVRYMKAAGFDPKAMLVFLERLQGKEQAHTTYLPPEVVRPQYARTHPYIPDRTRAVKEAIFGVADYIDYLNTTD